MNELINRNKQLEIKVAARDENARLEAIEKSLTEIKSLFTHKDRFVDKRIRAGNIGVIIKAAKRLPGFDGFERKLKSDLLCADDNLLDVLKEPGKIGDYVKKYI